MALTARLQRKESNNFNNSRSKAWPLEHCHEVFEHLIDSIQHADESVSPERVADTLALGLLLLHPFKDGNGRTARVVGLMFRDDYDGPSYETDINEVSQSRDELRKKGGFIMNGYILYINGDQSDPTVCKEYITSLLQSDGPLYKSCYGQAPLTSQ